MTTASVLSTATPPATQGSRGRQQMNVVIIGHVDHGKSTVVGRLLADTGSLPKGKIEMIREQCRRGSRPFEHAFLLDALKDEQAQGITIDSARCFFRSPKREYVIIDAPGHIEFLKNMVSGAARAEAGILVIDAREGVQENSRRHGYLASMLGIRQIAVCINKMDLVGYDRQAFDAIRGEYSAFLEHVGLRSQGFIPAAAREGENIVTRSANMNWYEGPTVLETLDGFAQEASRLDKPLRLPVQDIYKFTEQGDDRRIVAGRIETGRLRVGDEVIFFPSGKRSTVASVEGFNTPPVEEAFAGQSIGVTLKEQIYVQRGELMCKAGEPLPRTGTTIRAHLFWLGRQPMIRGKRYKLKLAGMRLPVWLKDVVTVLDASNLTTDANRKQIERHDVAECLLETVKPVACDLALDIPQTGRFVIIDNYEIAGGGIVTDVPQPERTMVDEHVAQREKAWVRSAITPGLRVERYRQRAALVIVTGSSDAGTERFAKALEEYLFSRRRLAYYLGISNTLAGIDADLQTTGERDETLRRLGEVAHLFTDAGLILIATVPEVDDAELEMIERLNRPTDLLVVNVGEGRLTRRQPELHIEDVSATREAVERVTEMLERKSYLLEYYL